MKTQPFIKQHFLWSGKSVCDWGCIFVTAALGVTFPVITVFYFILICDVWHFEGFACGGRDGKQSNHTRNVESCQVKHQSHTGGWDSKDFGDMSLLMAVRAMGSLLPLDFGSGAGNTKALPRFERFYQYWSVYPVKRFCLQFPRGKQAIMKNDTFLLFFCFYMFTYAKAFCHVHWVPLQTQTLPEFSFLLFKPVQLSKGRYETFLSCWTNCTRAAILATIKYSAKCYSISLNSPNCKLEVVLIKILWFVT